MLIDLNKEIIQYRIEISDLRYVNKEGIQAEKLIFNKEFKKRMWMVVGEGTVFLGLLIFGIYKTKEAFRLGFYFRNLLFVPIIPSNDFFL